MSNKMSSKQNQIGKILNNHILKLKLYQKEKILINQLGKYCLSIKILKIYRKIFFRNLKS
jgi:hypothetical protein